MAKGSRPEDETAPRGARRRRRPPVLELEAKELEAKELGAGGKEREEASGRERPRAAGPAQESPWDRLRARAAAGDWRALLPMPVLTGALGVLLGALAVALLMPRGEGADPRLGRLSEEVATLSARIESLAARPEPAPAPAADQGALFERIDKLTAAVLEAEQRLAAVERRPEPPAPDLSAVNARTATIESTLTELRASLGELARLAERAPTAVSSQSIDRLAGRIGGLEERIAALAAERAAPAPARAGLAAEIVALDALAGAVRAGGPFVRELEGARASLGERASALAPLESFAAAGLPTVALLETRFATLVPRLLRGHEPDGNFFERLMTNASRLVEVRPVGEPQGTDTAAVVARTEARLALGDLAGAIAEAESLPEPAGAAAAEWLAAAKARRDAEALIGNLAAAALAEAREAARP